MKKHPSIMRWLPLSGSTAKTHKGQVKACLAYLKRKRRPDSMAFLESRSPVTHRDRTQLRRFSDEDRMERRYKADVLYAEAEDKRRVAAILADEQYQGPALKVGLKRFGLYRVAVHYATVQDHGIKVTQVGKDARLMAGWRTELSRSSGYTEWKHGKPVAYNRATCDQYVRSFVHITNKRRMVFFFGPAKLTRMAPSGHYWNIDNQGLRLVRGSDGSDFHPEAELLLDPNWADRITRDLDRLAKVRAERQEQERMNAKLSTLADVIERSGNFKVGVADSVSAGNCKVGTVNWASSHGFSAKAWYDPRSILSADPGNGRVRIAVREAAMRHARLTAAGAEVFYP